MLVQPVNNYQNNYYNNSFKAQIIKTEYLMKGLEHAKQKPLNIQADVINFLEHIQHDRKIDIFRIFNEKEGKNDISVVQADDKQYTNPNDELGFVSFARNKHGKMILTKGGLCIAAIKDFMEKHYGQTTVTRLIRRGEKQYGLDKINRLATTIKYSTESQRTQEHRQILESIEQKAKKELAERYNRFEASLTNLNE